MARKSTWLPGGARREPGARWDPQAGPDGLPKSPLAAVGWAAFIIAMTMGLIVFSLSIPGPMSIGGLIAMAVGSLVFLALAAFLLVYGIRRWRWRRRNTHLTGGIYVRPWQRTTR